MIVIPPSTLQETYFKSLAEASWTNANSNQKESCDALKSENRTLVITCKVDTEDNLESQFNLHYRYFKGELYCFIEEYEPVKKAEAE